MKSDFICDKKLFSYIYELEKRRSNRAWHSTYLVQIELSFPNGLTADLKSNAFINILMNNIRSTDIVYQWDDNVFLLILCDLNNEDATNVVTRISDNYFKNKRKKEPGLEIRLWPLTGR